MGLEKERQEGGHHFIIQRIWVRNYESLLYPGMILFTLSISTREFALSLPKRPYINEDSISHL